MKKALLKIFFLFHFSLFIFHFSTAQVDSTIHAKISLLTCAPGGELYATFGHTALRAVDSSKNFDVVFNYGTFDFSDPDFYTKFTRGKLDYFLSVEPFQNFIYGYQMENRSVWEQDLNITNAEKKKIMEALQINLTGANRYYKYDFLYDNCTSRVKDILLKQVSLTVTKPLVKEGTTFRNMLHEYLDGGHMPWSKLGIDILLGSPTDKKVSIEESLFLPDYLMKAVDSSVNTNKPLLKQKNVLFNAKPETFTNNKHEPFFVFSLVWVLLLLYRSKNAFVQKAMPFIHSFLLYATGFLGILLLFMWFGTDHKACAANYNLLWALPTNTIAAFFVWRKPLWLKKYFQFTSFVYILLLVSWFFLPQQLNISLIPIVIILLSLSVKSVKMMS